MTSDALHRALSGELPSGVRRLYRRLREAGFRAWVVGGSVRDALRAALSGQKRQAAQNDWDIATDARPEQVMRLFSQVVPVGIQHGTVLVVLDGVGYEVTTLRGETTYSDGRHPDEVRFVDDITLDLARRDFTVNAIAFDPETEQLIDPFGGVRDLKARVLRAVGVPAERFSEDGLRVLRAARFVATLEFSLDPETERAISPSLDTYRKVSAERIRDEWVKAMKARQPSRAFEVMRQHGLLAVTAPELLESVGCAQNRHHAYDVWEHTMRCVDASPAASPVVRMAALLHDIAKPRMRRFDEASQDYTFHEHERIGADMAATLAERLRFSNDERERIVALVRHHLIFYEPSWSDRAVRRWLRRVSPELLGDLLQLGRADIVGKGRDPAADFARLEALERHVDKVLAEGTPLTLRDLAVGGRDLMEIGLEPGPAFGRILRTLLDEVIDEPSRNQRDILLERARQIAEEP